MFSFREWYRISLASGLWRFCECWLCNANGWQRRDDDLHDAPYRGIAAYPGDAKTSGNIYAEDMAQWTPGTGAANGNYGDLTFFESVGPSMQFSSIN